MSAPPAVELFLRADLALNKLRKDTQLESKRLLATVRDAKEKAISQMVISQRNAIRVNHSTWVVMQVKPGSFPRLSVDTLVDTITGIELADHEDPREARLRNQIHRSFALRGDGTTTLTLQCHPPGKMVEGAEHDDSNCASEYVDALSSMKMHMDGIRAAREPHLLQRKEHEVAVIDYVTNNSTIPREGQVCRSVDCTETGTKLFIKIAFTKRKRSVSRSTFMQLIDAELAARFATESTDPSSSGDSFLSDFRSNLESTLNTYTDGGVIQDIGTRVTISKTRPRLSRSN